MERKRPPKDLPKDELVRLAEETRKATNGAVDFHFKYTCKKCKTRCTLQETNTVYDTVECFNCGHIQPFTKGGLVAVFSFPSLVLQED